MAIITIIVERYVGICEQHAFQCSVYVAVSMLCGMCACVLVCMHMYETNISTAMLFYAAKLAHCRVYYGINIWQRTNRCAKIVA